MKFKSITPGMVIHCPKEEDARALLEHLDELGYRWRGGGTLSKTLYDEGSTYYLNLEPGYSYPLNIMHGCYENAIKRNIDVTEFSDLIEPDSVNEPNTSSNAQSDNSNAQMSAVEVLGWLKNNYRDEHVFTEVFGKYFRAESMLLDYQPQEIIERITAYEAAKAPKPVEVEWGYRCYIDKSNIGRTVNEYILWGVNEQAAKDDVIDKALKYTKETGEQVIAGVTFICRVKEGKS
ncbi:MAG: hypothetical protein LUE23_04355 [Lachnospiraceae bacterium]|nr:hypothetical protein [Lachnospiraceae bacterium]